MYDWGKRFGWEPVIWKDDQPHPAPQAPPAAPYATPGQPTLGAHGPGHLQPQQQHSQQQAYPQQGRGAHSQQQRMMHHHGQHNPGSQRGMGSR